MAVEKEKVVTALNVMYKGKPLSKDFKDKLATAYAPLIDNDTDIDDYLKERDVIITAMIPEIDKRVTDAVKKAKATSKDGDDPKEIDPEEDEYEAAMRDPNTTPAMKLILKDLQQTKGELATIKAEKSQSSIEDRFRNHADLKGLPEFMFVGRIPKNDDEFEAKLEEAKTAYGELRKISPNLPELGNDDPAQRTPGQEFKPTDDKINPGIQAFADQQKADLAEKAKQK